MIKLLQNSILSRFELLKLNQSYKLAIPNGNGEWVRVVGLTSVIP